MAGSSPEREDQQTLVQRVVVRDPQIHPGALLTDPSLQVSPQFILQPRDQL